MKRYEKYGRKASWIVKRYGKYGRKDRTDMKNTEEVNEKIGKIQTKGKLNSEMMWKIWKENKLKVKCYGKYGKK